MNKQEMYKAKQVWLERVMASKLSHAQKTFAFCIYTRAYGIKTVSHPETKHIMEDGGFTSSGHFTDYRRALVDCGAIKAELDYHTVRATNKNYEYTLNLDWDGAVAPQGGAVAPAGESHSTPWESHSTTGASNTTNNTSRNTSIKTITDEPVVPTVSFDRVELGKDRYIYQMKDVAISSNQESTEPVYFVDLTGVTKSPAVAPAEAWPDEAERPDGAVNRVDYENDYTHGGWLFYSKAAAARARRPVAVGGDW